MKKAILLVSIAALTATGVSVLALKSSKSLSSLASPASNEAIVPGTIVIGEGKNSISNGLNHFTSSNGNDFQIYCDNITNTDGVYSFSDAKSYIMNYDALHGIYQIDIYGVDGTGDGFITYGYDDAFENKGDLFELTEGECSFSFASIQPNYFYLSSNNNTGAEPILFTKIVIYYSCSEAERVSDITSVRQTIDGYEVSAFNQIFLEAGTNLADIPLANLKVDYSVVLNNPGVTDVSIEYKEELLKNSTTVIEGEHDVSISFHYNGYLYINSSSAITIVGYDHYSVYNEDEYLMSMEYRIQETNATFPENFSMIISKEVRYFDSSDNNLLNTSFNIFGIEITDEMVVSMDTDAFTGRGDHTITISYLGNNYSLDYRIYDPEYNNIRSIYISGQFTYEAGVSASVVLADLISAENYVSYYEDKPNQPSSVTLTSENFDITEGMFDNPGYVQIDFHYQNYVSYVCVRISVARGNFVKTYVNTEGINVGGEILTAVHLYDNGYCEFNEKGDAYNELFEYTLVDGVLSVNVYGAIMKFDVEDVNNTFVRHAKVANVIYNLKVNFGALGAPDAYMYDGIMYDDNTIEFDLEGMVVECEYTVDANDSNVIYFDFAAGMLYHCKGTIDVTLLQMLVEEVA